MARLNVAFLAAAVAAFVLHTSALECQDYLFSFFGIFELLYGLTNVLFHASATFDLGDSALHCAQDTLHSAAGPF